MTIKRNGPEPVYQQVAGEIRREIEAGTYAPGDAIPSGRELMERYEIALGTAQKAIETLKIAGVVEARGGRGVYVIDPTAPPTEGYDEVMAKIRELQDQASDFENRLRHLEQQAGDH